MGKPTLDHHTCNPAKVSIDNQERRASGIPQWFLEKDVKTHPITEDNKATFFICGEEGFGQIFKDINNANTSVDIVCWGFDPGMELVRDEGKQGWPRCPHNKEDLNGFENIHKEDSRVGALLERRAREGIKIRVLIWENQLGNNESNTMIGRTDRGGSSAYKEDRRQEYCSSWWDRNPLHRHPDLERRGLVMNRSPYTVNTNNSTGGYLKMLGRDPSGTDVKNSLKTEEDQPSTVSLQNANNHNPNSKYYPLASLSPMIGIAGAVYEKDRIIKTAKDTLGDEKNLLNWFPSFHQKPILIDYPVSKDPKMKSSIGYVMGLNLITDFWDASSHFVDDPRRESITQSTNKGELEHVTQTDGRKVDAGYKHAKPYQDYACRIWGPALAGVHANFEQGWARAQKQTPPPLAKLLAIPKSLSALLPKTKSANRPNKDFMIQTLRTEPHWQDKTIKDAYYQSTICARNYIYIENQYFFYPAFVRHIKNLRINFVRDWMKKNETACISKYKMPILHLFIVIPNPEDDGMMPRTTQSLDKLGAAKQLPKQVADTYHLTDRHSNNDPDLKVNPKTLTKGERDVLDLPATMKQLEDILGLRVCVCMLRTNKTKHGVMPIHNVADWETDPNSKGKYHPLADREIYIHSKLMMIDDAFLTVGSANMDQRSMAVDGEFNISMTSNTHVADLRKRVFKMHSGDTIEGSGVREEVPDVFYAWQKLAKVNSGNAKKGLPTNGFLRSFMDYRSNDMGALHG